MGDPRVDGAREFVEWLELQPAPFTSLSTAVDAWELALRQEVLESVVSRIREISWGGTRTPAERIALIASVVGEE